MSEFEKKVDAYRDAIKSAFGLELPAKQALLDEHAQQEKDYIELNDAYKRTRLAMASLFLERDELKAAIRGANKMDEGDTCVFCGQELQHAENCIWVRCQ